MNKFKGSKLLTRALAVLNENICCSSVASNSQAPGFNWY